jgi:hypothetical protein
VVAVLELGGVGPISGTHAPANESVGRTSTRTLVPGLDAEDLGEHALNDFPAARRIFHLPVDGRGAAAFASIGALETGKTNLPDQISSFIGRDADLAELRELVSENRLVSLVGSGSSARPDLR